MATSGPFMLATVGCSCCGPGFSVCGTCSIPAEDLTLTYTNIILGNDTTTLVYSMVGGQPYWISACRPVAGSMTAWYTAALTCVAGNLIFSFTLATNNICTTGLATCASNLSPNFKLTLVSITCGASFSAEYTTVPSCPGIEAPGFITMTITA